MQMHRRPPLRGHGATVVAVICAYELVALIDETPLPTISHVVENHRHGRLLGVALLAGFACHWWANWGGEELAGDVIDVVT